MTHIRLVKGFRFSFIFGRVLERVFFLFYKSEYLARRDERRAFMTGFDGSAGTAVVSQTEALVWTDGRYFEQAEQQLYANWTLMRMGLLETPSINDWLTKNCQTGDFVGMDANLMSSRTWVSMQTAIEKSGCKMKAITPNLVDLIWKDQPSYPTDKLIALDVKYAGRLAGDKVIEVRAAMLEQKVNLLVVTALDEIACKDYQV